MASCQCLPVEWFKWIEKVGRVEKILLPVITLDQSIEKTCVSKSQISDDVVIHP